jgi:hypothetical protein
VRHHNPVVLAEHQVPLSRQSAQGPTYRCGVAVDRGGQFVEGRDPASLGERPIDRQADSFGIRLANRWHRHILHPAIQLAYAWTAPGQRPAALRRTAQRARSATAGMQTSS